MAQYGYVLWYTESDSVDIPKILRDSKLMEFERAWDVMRFGMNPDEELGRRYSCSPCAARSWAACMCRARACRSNRKSQSVQSSMGSHQDELPEKIRGGACPATQSSESDGTSSPTRTA